MCIVCDRHAQAISVTLSICRSGFNDPNEPSPEPVLSQIF
jgi:hypothetical protein